MYPPFQRRMSYGWSNKIVFLVSIGLSLEQFLFSQYFMSLFGLQRCTSITTKYQIGTSYWDGHASHMLQMSSYPFQYCKVFYLGRRDPGAEDLHICDWTANRNCNTVQIRIATDG